MESRVGDVLAPLRKDSRQSMPFRALPTSTSPCVTSWQWRLGRRRADLGFQAYRVDGDLRRRRFAERQSASVASTRMLARLVRRPGFDLFFSLASWNFEATFVT